MTEPDRYSWAQAGTEDLGGGVHRIPLPLPMAGLKAVNVYALIDETGVDLIDAGMGLANARDRLTGALKELGCELGDIRNFFITHVHRDHYTLAVDLRRSRYGSIWLGVGEQANLAAARATARGEGGAFLTDLNWMGAAELAVKIEASGADRPLPGEWDEPDTWLADGTELEVRSRTLRAIHTPGHTRGHLVYLDSAASVLFAGDHILPHITPTIGMEPARNRGALRDYMDSLRLVLTLPDTRLLPAHGPVQASTHKRVHELLAHHEQRLAEILDAMAPGRSTAYEVAQAIRWTRRQLRFAELDTISQLLAVGETASHLELLVVRGQLIRHAGADGTDHYEVATRSAPE
jgi:glyoxylase-like metal-dependent hydrolase (beta-lactamase superfamily II)